MHNAHVIMNTFDTGSLTLRQLHVFVTVLEQGGFGAAADHLQMSQSAVSHALAATERVLGAPLIIRTPLTKTTTLGAAILPHARSALASMAALHATVDCQREGRTGGIVRLAAAPTASHRLVPELLKRWRTELPGLNIRLFEGGDDELPVWLSDGVVDAAVLIDPDPIPAGSIVLARDDFQAVLRSDHPLAVEERIPLRDLLDDPLLVSSSGCETQINAMHTLAGLPYSPAQRVHEMSTLLGMVDAELGVAILPSLARTLLPNGLVMVKLEPHLERALVFTGPSNRPWHPSVEPMRDIAASRRTPD